MSVRPSSAGQVDVLGNRIDRELHELLGHCIDCMDGTSGAVKEQPHLAATSVDINGEGCVEYVYRDIEKDGEFSFGIPDHLRQRPRVAAAANVNMNGDGCAPWRRPER